MLTEFSYLLHSKRLSSFWGTASARFQLLKQFLKFLSFAGISEK